MSTVEIETGRYVKRFEFWNPSTWAIPALYWDTFSQEQRIHAICRQLGKVVAYADYLGVNVDDIAARLKAIEDGELDEIITAAIEQWFEEHEPEISAALTALNEALPIDAFDAENTVKSAIDAANHDIEGLQTDKLDKTVFETAFPNTAERKLEIIDCYYDTTNNLYIKTFKIPRSLQMNILPASAMVALSAYDYVTQNNPVFMSVGPLGSQIVSNGVVIGNLDDSESYHWYVLGIDADGNVDMVKDETEALTGNDLLARGYVTAFRIWSPVISNGIKFNWNAEIHDDGTTNKTYIFEGKHSRAMLGWDDDYWYFIYIEGQIPNSTGTDFDGMYDVALRYNLENVCNMDGGGSVQAWTSKPTFNNIFQNKRIRRVPYSRNNPLIEFVEGE